MADSKENKEKASDQPKTPKKSKPKKTSKSSGSASKKSKSKKSGSSKSSSKGSESKSESSSKGSSVDGEMSPQDPETKPRKKVKVQAKRDCRGRYGTFTFRFVKGETYEVEEEIADWLKKTDRAF